MCDSIEKLLVEILRKITENLEPCVKLKKKILL